MRHARHYSLAEATAALDWVRERLEALRGARDRLADEEARGALADAAPSNGGGASGKLVGEAFVEVQRLLGQLEAMEIVVRDLDTGLVDFPAIRDGDEVYLCWKEGEDAIEFWHDPESGFGGRRPL